MENNDDDLKVPGPVEWNFCVQVYSWQQGERGLQLICVVLSTLNYYSLPFFLPSDKTILRTTNTNNRVRIEEQ